MASEGALSTLGMRTLYVTAAGAIVQPMHAVHVITAAGLWLDKAWPISALALEPLQTAG